jgi:hypothetical protein
MAGVSALLEAAQEAGLSVHVEGTTLRVRGPRAAEALARRLLAEKEAILALWHPTEEQKTPLGDTCDTCDSFRTQAPAPAPPADVAPNDHGTTAPRPGLPLIADRPAKSQAAWHEFIRQWHDVYKSSAATTRELFALAIVMPTLGLGAGDERSRRAALERKLVELRDHVIAEYWIDGVDERDTPRLWRLWPLAADRRSRTQLVRLVRQGARL